MSAVLTRAELDGMSCAECGKTHDHGLQQLKARCHTGAALMCWYDAQFGWLLVACSACLTPIARVQVAFTVPS
jgi:hypothetical protein